MLVNIRYDEDTIVVKIFKNYVTEEAVIAIANIDLRSCQESNLYSEIRKCSSSSKAM